jgi:hypothetical protein
VDFPNLRQVTKWDALPQPFVEDSDPLICFSESKSEELEPCGADLHHPPFYALSVFIASEFTEHTGCPVSCTPFAMDRSPSRES